MKAQVAAKNSLVSRFLRHRVNHTARSRSTHNTAASNDPDATTSRPNVKGVSQQISDERDFFIDVLGATGTKREAKSYLSRFRPKTSKFLRANSLEKHSVTQLQNSGVNLGSLYLPIRSIEESPVFSQIESERPFLDPNTQPLRTALVLLKISEGEVSSRTLRDVGRTLQQLSKLGLNCVVVLDVMPGSCAGANDPNWRSIANAQADRAVAAIEETKDSQSIRLDGSLEVYISRHDSNSKIKLKGSVRVTSRNLLLKPLYRGVIPVIPPVAFDPEMQRLVPVDSSEIVLALARDLAGLTNQSGLQEDWTLTDEARSKAVSLDRVIVLDPHGGIPSPSRLNSSHVFVNLEQEYGNIQHDLVMMSSDKNEKAIKAHASNLELVRDVLSILPPSSSAFILTPEAASETRANSELADPAAPGVATRPTRNALIHNLLTDKPIFSSSLPASRLSYTQDKLSVTLPVPLPPTFLKHGLPVTIFPDPNIYPWNPPRDSNPPFSLSDPSLDMGRLIHLIEDSFGRKLDAKSYFERIAPRLAGIIVAGAYEGGAILTWETPPALESTGPPSSTTLDVDLYTEPARMVPYLDKFAVLQRSQGAGGVADVVFNAMVRKCFPTGVVWRSRSNNPVNKWYFERARGSWKIPSEKGQQSWTMFWTTEGVDGHKFADYEGVCRSIGTNWADGKARLD